MFNPGDVYAYKYKDKGFIPFKVIALSELEENVIVHCIFYSVLFEKPEDITDLTETDNLIPHIAIVEDKIMEAGIEYVRPEPVFNDEEHIYRLWQQDWNNKISRYFNISLEEIMTQLPL